MYEIPSELLNGPFTVEQSREVGLPRGVLVRRFVRLYPRVWCHPGHPVGNDDRVLAATLALPDRARLTGTSRIQQLGLDFGPRIPIGFVIRLRNGHLTVESQSAHWPSASSGKPSQAHRSPGETGRTGDQRVISGSRATATKRSDR